MRNRLRHWLNEVPIYDPVERRQAALFQVLLLGLISVLIIAALLTALNLIVPGGPPTNQLIVTIAANLAGALLIVVPLALLRRGRLRVSVLIVMLFFLLGAALSLRVQGVQNNSIILLELAIPVALAALVLGRRMLLLTFGTSVALVAAAAIAPQPAATPYSPFAAAINFVLIMGLLTLFLDRFGAALRVDRRAYARAGAYKPSLRTGGAHRRAGARDRRTPARGGGAAHFRGAVPQLICQ
jgi:hypothetical protein